MGVIEETLKVINAITIQSREVFFALPSEILNWKPSPERWSAAQCLDHMIAAHGAYFPIFKQIQRGEYRTRPWERVPFLPVLFGRSLVEGLSDETNKLQAPTIFQPSHSNISPEIIPRFIANQEELIIHIGKLREDDLDRVITSPVTRWVVYSLRDTCHIIAVHETLHFKQARRTLALYHSETASS